MNESDFPAPGFEDSLHLSEEDRQAYQQYLKKKGIDSFHGTDPVYDTILDQAGAEHIRPLVELAAELPESQAGAGTIELKLAMAPREKEFAGEFMDRLDRANRTRHGNADEAVAKTFMLLNTYWDDAEKDIIKLNFAVVSPPDEDSYLELSLIRSRPEVREVLTKYLTVNSNWEDNFWPKYNEPEFKDRQETLRGLVTDMVMHADDSTLGRLATSVYELAENRRRFWNGTKAKAESMRPVKRVSSSPKRILGSYLRPRPAYLDMLPGNVDEQLPLEPEISREPHDFDTDSAPPKPVADVLAEREERVEQRAARWEELTDKNKPPGRIEEILDKEFPDLRSPERIEELALKEDAETRRRKREENELSGRGKPSHHLHQRGSSRPVHGSRQLQIKDTPPQAVQDEMRRIKGEPL